jgi:hypothetical protein
MSIITKSKFGRFFVIKKNLSKKNMYTIPKLCFLIICAVIISLHAKSQTIVGLQGGINVSALAGPKDYDENKLRIGISTYAYADFSLGRFSILSLETGIGISQQGMKHIKVVENVASKTTTTTQNKLDYIFIPVYLRENLTDFYTKIGPYAAYNINAKSKWKSVETRSFAQISDPKEDFDLIYQDNVRPYDLGLSFGIGYVHFFQPGVRRHIGRGRKKLKPVVQIDFRYNMGFLKIGVDPDVPNMNLRNQTFTLGVTITSVRN